MATRRISAKPTTKLQEDEHPRGPGTLAKGLDLLDLVMNGKVTGSAAAITEALQLPRPTTNRLIATLIRLGMLRRDGRRRVLVEGERLRRLALAVLMRSSDRGPAHELLTDLARATSETCNIGTLSGGRVHYVDRVEAQWPLALRLEPGSTVPVHCSALGKVLLAHAASSTREKYLNTITLTRYTPNTITDRAILESELSEIAARGYSIDNEEYFEGVVGMAVPIPNLGGPAVLGLAVAAPSVRVSAADLKTQLSLLRKVASKLALCY